MQLIQPSHFMLLLLIQVMTLSNLYLIGCHKNLLIVSLLLYFLLLLLQLLDLGLGVELVDTYTSYFIEDVLLLDFLLFDLKTQSIGLLQ